MSNAAKKLKFFSLAIDDDQGFAHQASSPFSLKMTLGMAQSFLRRVKQIN